MRLFIFLLSFLFLSKELRSSQANFFSPKTIHVLGDSHSREFSQIPGCIIHWLGPITMHRVGRDGFSCVHLPSLNVQEGQIAIFCFGEIDVRCHVAKQAHLKNLPLEKTINTLAKKYIHTIKNNRNLYNNITCIVYSITPPTNQIYSNEYPFYGSLEERINITHKLNETLANLCSQEEDIFFLDVYENYAEKDGSLNSSLSDGNVHIHPSFLLPIQKKLTELLSSRKTYKE